MAPAAAPNGSLLSTTVTLIANLVGAGLLSLPYTLKRAGLIPGATAMCSMALLNTLSLLIIARCCELSGKYTYRDIATAALGETAGAIITAVMAIYTLGSCVSFAVLLGDFVPSLICEAGCDDETSAGGMFIHVIHQRWITVTVLGALILLPLSLLRDLSSLRFTSTLSCVCILYSAAMISIRAILGPVVSFSELNVAGGPTGLFIAAPILCVAFTLHYNVPKYYAELKDRSIQKFAIIAIIAFVAVLIVYEATAIGGYLLFGSATQGDILSNFADGDIPALIARVALTCIVVSCYPLAFNAFRASVIALLPLKWQAHVLEPRKDTLVDTHNAVTHGAQRNGKVAVLGNSPYAVEESGNVKIGVGFTGDEDTESSESASLQRLLDANDAETEQDEQDLYEEEEEWNSAQNRTASNHDRKTKKVKQHRTRNNNHSNSNHPSQPSSTLSSLLSGWFQSMYRDMPHIMLTTLLVAISLAIGIGVPQVAVVLGYKGALGGSLIVYVFPAAMYFALVQKQRYGLLSMPVKVNTSTPTTTHLERQSFADNESTLPSTASVWNAKAIFNSSHGLIFLSSVLLGTSILVLGTATTAGVLG